MFAQVEVELTEDPERLLVALVRFRPGTPERQVASFLEAVWITELRLSGLDVFHSLTDPGHVEFEAVTGDQDSGYVLSLQLVALEGDAQDFEGRPGTATPPPGEAGSQPLGAARDSGTPPPDETEPRTKKRFWQK